MEMLCCSCKLIPLRRKITVTHKKPSIAILGAGIGGLAASACLRKAGIETTIYEQAPAFARIGAGIQMSPNAMRVLYGIGIGDSIRATAFEPPHWRNRDHDTGNLTNDHPLGPDAYDRYGVPYLLMHRGDLHAELHGAVPDDTIRYDHKVAGIEQSDSGVTLTFENGEKASADALIASDGVHSIVRESLLGAEDARFTGSAPPCTDWKYHFAPPNRLARRDGSGVTIPGERFCFFLRGLDFFNAPATQKPSLSVSRVLPDRC